MFYKNTVELVCVSHKHPSPYQAGGAEKYAGNIDLTMSYRRRTLSGLLTGVTPDSHPAQAGRQDH